MVVVDLGTWGLRLVNSCVCYFRIVGKVAEIRTQNNHQTWPRLLQRLVVSEQRTMLIRERRGKDESLSERDKKDGAEFDDKRWHRHLLSPVKQIATIEHVQRKCSVFSLHIF